MNCEFAHTAVHGYFDGELDAVRAADFEKHLESCDECQASLEHIDLLRTKLRGSDLYEQASPELRARVRQQLAAATEGESRGRMASWRKLLVPAFAALAVIMAVGLTFLLTGSRTDSTRITAELIDAHVRSLQPGHLTDVVSTDQHTVKPWFDGRLDFIPPVTDYAAQGFPLVGGRLDVVDGHNVAAVVYSRRKHIINLFVWPSQKSVETSGSRQGYNWIVWHANDMQFCLMSDVSADDLRQLRKLIER